MAPAVTENYLQLKRIYEPPQEGDGMRILVDRLWPRGVRKDDARIDLWMKDIAPSPELRKWFCHDPALFEDFRTAYQVELEQSQPQRGAINQLIQYLNAGPVTLLFAAKDPVYNHAVVLREYIVDRLAAG